MEWHLLETRRLMALNDLVRKILHIAFAFSLVVVPGEAKSTEYSSTDRRSLAAPPEAERNIQSLSRYLSAGIPSAIWDPRVKFWVKNAEGDELKARAIFRWITDRIAYQLTIPTGPLNNHEYCAPDGAYWSSVVGPEATLSNRKAYCVSYSLLFQALATEADLRVVFIGGRAGTNGNMYGHAWNAVKLGDNWRMIDVTWGAGRGSGANFEKKFDERWFLTPRERFLRTHVPDQRYLEW